MKLKSILIFFVCALFFSCVEEEQFDKILETLDEKNIVCNMESSIPDDEDEDADEDIDMSERCKYYLQIINENFIKSLYGSG